MLTPTRTSFMQAALVLLSTLGLSLLALADGVSSSRAPEPLPAEVVQVVLNLAKNTGTVSSRQGEAKADAANLLSTQLDGLRQQLEAIRIPPEAVEPIRAVAKQYASGPPSDVNMSASAMQAVSAFYAAAQAPLWAERKGEADRKQEDERTKRFAAFSITAILVLLAIWLIARPPSDKALKQLAPLIIGAILGYWLKP